MALPQPPSTPPRDTPPHAANPQGLHDVVLRARDLGSKFGFGDGGLLDDQLAVIAAILGVEPESTLPARTGTPEPEGEDAYSLREGLLTALVETHLVPACPVAVVTRRVWSHNPVRATWVGRHRVDDGLSAQAERLLAGCEVRVTGAEVLALAQELVRTGMPPRPPQPLPEFGDVLVDGLAGLVGRRVEVELAGGGDPAYGTLLGVHADGLLLAGLGDSEELTLLPHRGVRAVRTGELSPPELARVWELADDL